MIERIRKPYWVEYICTDCNKVLAELVDSGEVIIHENCKHYRWTETSTECYYYMLPGCGRSYIRWLKENYIVKLEAPGTVYLLLSRQN